MYPRLLSPLGPPWTPGKPATAVFVAKKCCHLVAQSQSYQYPHTLLTFLPPPHSTLRITHVFATRSLIRNEGLWGQTWGESLKPPMPFEFGSLEWDQLSHGISLPMGSAIPWDLSFLGIIPPTRSTFPQDQPPWDRLLPVKIPVGSTGYSASDLVFMSGQNEHVRIP